MAEKDNFRVQLRPQDHHSHFSSWYAWVKIFKVRVYLDAW
ncbi:hypothetical protein FOYG_09556 [Fusarium oxysporum NRRL 32931]|uniref:Uncharacterized protein n=1 Tax=Fusarium oxysporum NRRL 32931 TaxID=660029 RepID=W9I717_FUSOX|nr:hypothetical protein FOYG_09556 [Fusarium oxysporum NRRL 32931]